MMNTPKNLLLTIDQGTQSVRAMVFDTDGNLLAKSQIHIQAYYARNVGWAEQDCDYYWTHLCQACQNLWLNHADLKARIAALSITTQRMVTVCLDADKQPLRPAISWLDQRRTYRYKKLPWYIDLAIRGAWQKKSIHYAQSKAECNWLAADEPQMWARVRHFVFLSGYYAYLLTGRLCDSVGAQVGYVPFDCKKHTWSRAGDIRWKLFNVQRDMLPELVPAGQMMGRITATAAKQTGIPEGLPLYASGADKACEVLGSGAWSPEVGSISYGTTATINTSNSKYVAPLKFVPAFPAAVPNFYNSEIAVLRGYWMVNWFKEQFAAQEVFEAEQQGIAPEVLFERLLEQTPAGNMGLMLQPFWNPAAQMPGPEAKGAMIGFGDVHHRGHMYRAIIEGIGYALLEAMQHLEKRNGIKITRLKVSGGGSQSDAIMQLTADLFGISAERVHTYETSGLGAAINAAVGAGFYPDHQTAQQHMSRTGQVFAPNLEKHQLYHRLYKEVYVRMYGRLAPLYRSIRHITQYPAFD